MAIDVKNTTCHFCGVGCGLGLRVEEDQVIGVEPQLNHPVSQGQLCAKGWSTAFSIRKDNRIRRPMIRENSEFHEVSWNVALDFVAERLTQYIDSDCPDKLGVISSARATNEDNYACQKFARAVLGTNNIDHCARICHSPSVAGLKQTLGSGAMTNSVSDIDVADAIMVFGADPTENHSVLGGRIMKAQSNGAKLIVVDPRKTRLAHLADVHLQLKLGTNITLINGLLNIIFSEGWEDREFMDSRCDNAEALRQQVKKFPLETVSNLTGVSPDLLILAAEIYSHAKCAFLAYGMGVTQFVCGTDNVIAISNLALSCGQIGRAGTGINPLRGQNNVQGACDMGCLPNVYPGYQVANDALVQDKFSRAWGVSVPTTEGLTSLGMTGQAEQQNFKALLIFGENQVVTDPDQNHVLKALQALDLLVVTELTMTETAKLAHVVLPATSFAEKNGTFTNCERRVQLCQQAVSALGEAKSDWQIVKCIAERMGSKQLDWSSSQEIFDEMSHLTPIYSAMDYPKLAQYQGLQWPCDGQSPLGTKVLHSESFPIGKARLIPVDSVKLDEEPDRSYPFALTTNRLHYHYGCGSMTRQSPLLERETSSGYLFINPNDGKELGLNDGQGVQVNSRRGRLETRAKFSTDLPKGLVSMPYHFKEAPANQLTNNAVEPITQMPELKACAVNIVPLPLTQGPRSIDAILREASDECL
jgi:formate dehydrogenase major subunit